MNGTMQLSVPSQITAKGFVMAKFRGVVLDCEECGRAFKVPPSRAASARYCSKDCADQHRGESLQKQYVTLECLRCGKKFETPPSHVSRRKYCSYRCKDGDPLYRAEISLRTRGDLNASWKGGRVLHADGYVYLHTPEHPFSSNGYVFEHRLVMERWLRENDPESPYLIKCGDQLYLSPDFIVHHRDEDKQHNTIDNLECMTAAEHARHHNS